jgi:YD repeat-containing protein
VLTTFGYDALNRQTAMTEAAGVWGLQRTTRSGYDVEGNRISVSRPLATTSTIRATPATALATAQFSYDALNRQVGVTDRWPPRVHRVRRRQQPHSPDRPGRSRDLTTFDAHNRRTRVDNADSTFTEWKYNPADSVREQTEQNGRNEWLPFAPRPGDQFRYDALGRMHHLHPTRRHRHAATALHHHPPVRSADHVTLVVSPEDERTRSNFDLLGRLRVATDRSNATAVNDYDAADRLVQSTDRDGRVILSTYDALGRLRVQDWLAFGGNAFAKPAPAQQHRWDYDAAGRLTGAANVIGSYSFYYDALGRTLTSVDPYGLTLGYTYDAADRQTTRSEFSNGRVVSVVQSAYDDAGLLTNRSLTANGLTLEVQLNTARGQVEELRRRAAGRWLMWG